MSLTKPQLILFGSIGLLIIVLILVFVGILPGLKSGSQTTVVAGNLKIWGVGDTSSNFDALFANLQKSYPKLTITYQGFDDPNDYENTLLDALASGRGPDIFQIQNTSLAREINKIIPVPATMFSLVSLEGFFPQVVETNFVSQGKIYALPLSIDTLGLIYNRDLLDQAAVTPPQTWEDLIKAMPTLVKTDSAKKITRAAAAIGGAENIENAPDVLNLLMLQTGTKMTTSDFSKASFASSEGLDALNFYTQFADAKSNAYTWNQSLPESLTMFSQGNLAMIFDYASTIPEIKARNPFLNLGVSALPQPQNAQKTLTYPNYWGFAVSRQSRNQNLAWQIILAMTTDPQNALAYLNATGKPPALRSLVGSYDQNPILSVFAKQILTARSWPEVNHEAVSEVFRKTIGAVLGGGNAQVLLTQAQDQVTQIMAKRL